MSMNLIKDLREKTGAGILDCKNALEASGNDYDLAVEWLRKKGLAAAAKKSTKAVAQGLVCASVSSDHKIGTLIEVNSETDFVALNLGFQNLVEDISQASIACNDLEALKLAQLKSEKSVQDTILDNIAVIGENLLLRKFEKVQVKNGIVSYYIHNVVKNKMGKIGVLVALESECDNLDALADLGKKLAMHIAAAKPLYLTQQDVPKEIVEKEREIFSSQCRDSGKPENIILNMIQGKLNNFFKEVVLLDQIFVMDNKSVITEVINNAAKSLNTQIKLQKFVRFELGEGVEILETNFADDVKSMVK